MPADLAGEATASPLPWAMFLGISWTWCIGMFLPVLIVRDYGPWGWVIFAVPNCIGAAAMGWVMRSATHSRAFVERRRVACEIFSLVTIAFQLFFATWMLPRLAGPAGYIAAAVLVQAAFTPIKSRRALLWLAMAACGVSVVMAAGLLWRHALIAPQHYTARPLDLLGIACICSLGFFTSPYLDLTFHQARQSTGVRGGRIAFAVGFCVIFASMIVLSFFYAGTFAQMVAVRSVSSVLLTVHLAVQMAFTVDAHAAAMRSGTAVDWLGRPVLALAIAFGFAAGLAGSIDWAYHGLPVGEIIYRLFLAYYGLIVPAYLLTARGRRPMLACALAILPAAPLMWVAFIERRMPWMIAAAAIVLLVAAVFRLPAKRSPNG